MKKINKFLLIFFTVTIGILLGIFLLGLFNKKDESTDKKLVNLILTTDTFEYGELPALIPIYKYVENKDDFSSIKSEPMTLSNKNVGVREIVFTVIPIDSKKQEVKIIKTVEIKDTQPAKIYPNYRWVESDYCGPVLVSVSDPVDGLLDFKENLTDNDRGYYTVYQDVDKRVVRAIDKNGNVSELFIDNYSGNIDSNTTLNEDLTVNSSGCNFEKGFDNIYYLTQEQAIEAARSYFNLYQAQSNSPKSFNVYITTCEDTTYYIWDFIW